MYLYGLGVILGHFLENIYFFAYEVVKSRYAYDITKLYSVYIYNINIRNYKFVSYYQKY